MWSASVLGLFNLNIRTSAKGPLVSLEAEVLSRQTVCPLQWFYYPWNVKIDLLSNKVYKCIFIMVIYKIFMYNVKYLLMS